MEKHNLSSLNKADPFTEPVVAKGERKLFRVAIHAQESREAADNKARAIVDDLRASKMAKAADLVEQAVHETLAIITTATMNRR